MTTKTGTDCKEYWIHFIYLCEKNDPEKLVKFTKNITRNFKKTIKIRVCVSLFFDNASHFVYLYVIIKRKLKYLDEC